MWHFFAYSDKTKNMAAWIDFDGKSLEQIEREVILGQLSLLKGNRTYTAQSLKISIRSLRDKLRTYRMMGIIVPGNTQNVQEVKVTSVEYHAVWGNDVNCI
jgi:hypothetical protein